MRIVNLDSTCVRCQSIWQYDYGMVLRLQGAKLPTATEIHFSFNERGGQAKPRIGLTKDGVTDVVIPDTFVENDFTSEDYKIYVFVYLTDENSGRTEYKITIPVKSRPELEAFDKPEDAELFHEAINEVNKSAESASESARQAQTAKDESVAAAKEAKQSAEEASTSTQEAQTSANASKESASVADSAAKAAISAKEIAVSAANSADNNALAASRSAQEAKQSAEQADTAAKSAAQSKQDIQTLQSEIDTTAEQIATDRTAVETDKKEVQKAKSSVEDLKEAVEQKSSEAITDINTAKDSAIKDVNTAKDTAVSAVTQKKESAVNAVNEAKDNVVAEINKNENVQQIQENKDNIEELQDSLSEIVTIGKNQFNIADLTNEFYSNDGTLTDNSNYLLTGFCDVRKKQGYYIASSYNGYYVQFDEDRKFIKKTNNILYNNNRRIESGTAYIRIGIGKNISEIQDEALWIEKEKITETPIYDEYGKSINEDVKIPLDMDELNKPIKELKNDVDQLNDKKITKFYANNLGETHLEDSDTGKIQDMVLYGKSEQKQYSGKNLLKYPYYDTKKTAEGITYIVNEDGSVTMQGTAISDSYFSFATKNETPLTLPASSYKLIVKGRNNSNVVVSNDSNTVVNQGILELAEDINKVFGYIYISKNTTVNETIYPMLQSTDYQDEDYEPYVGEIPSPNIEYPQEVRSVVNPVIKMIGKNILDLKTKGVNSASNSGVTYEKNKDGSYKRMGIAKTNEGNIWLCGNYNQAPKNDMSNVILRLKKNRTYFIKDCNLFASIDGIAIDLTGIKKADKDYYITGVRNGGLKSGNDYNDIVFPMVVECDTEPEWEPYKGKNVELPYKLNAMPVTSGGNITIDRQQYIADYIDIEKGKYIQRIQEVKLDADFNWNLIKGEKSGNYIFQMSLVRNGYTKSVGVVNGIQNTASSHFCYTNLMFDDNTLKGSKIYTYESEMTISFDSSSSIDSLDKFKQLLNENEIIVQYVLAEPIEHDLSEEDINKLKNLETYYDVTNIEVTSDQLDGYTTFNYPISLANGWDYVKQQLGDTRDYIYDMDVKAQDIDTQSAEAYVNSEYAVALTELEVM